MITIPRRVITPLVCFALATLVGWPARAASLDGDYAGVGNSFFEKISFRSGGKVRITAMGMTKVGTYEIDAKKVLITIGNETNVFTIDGQGCVVGGGFLGKYCKGGDAGGTAEADGKAGATAVPAPAAKAGARDKAAAPAQSVNPRLSGRYKAGDAKVNITLDFRSDQKVRIIVGGSQTPPDARNATYKVVGDQVTVSDPDGGAPLVLTRKGNGLEGAPEGEPMKMKFVKQ